MKTICESNRDRYTNCEDNILLQQVSIVHMLVWLFHYRHTNEYWLEDYKYQLHKIKYFVFDLIINTFGYYKKIFRFTLRTHFTHAYWMLDTIIINSWYYTKSFMDSVVI